MAADTIFVLCVTRTSAQAQLIITQWRSEQSATTSYFPFYVEEVAKGE